MDTDAAAPSGEGTLADLARLAASVEVSSAPPEVGARLVDVVTDGVYVMALGATAPDVAALLDDLDASPGPATLVGREHPVSVQAAMVGNSVALWRYQLTEGHRLARGHPGTALLPALLAVSEERDVSAESFLNAFLAGYEVGVRCAAAMGGTPRGIHDLGSWGPLGVAAAITRLRGGDEDAVCRAMAVASRMVLSADPETIFGGDASQYAFLPASVLVGHVSAQIARAGMGPSGNGADDPVPPGLLARWTGPHAPVWIPPHDAGGATTWTILEGYLKPHAVSGMLLSAADVAYAVRSQLGSDPGRVTDIHLEVSAEAIRFDAPSPSNDAEAYFSLPFIVAYILRHGQLWDGALRPGAVSDPDILRLASLVRLGTMETKDGARPARIRVSREDGSSHAAEVAHPRGQGHSEDSRAAVRAKWQRLSREAFGPDAQVVDDALDAFGRQALSPVQLGATLRGVAAGTA